MQRPEWSVEGERANRRVTLTGPWALFLRTHERKRLRAELEQLQDSQALVWDLSDIETLDSAGALLLWRLWGRQLPADLICGEGHRHWFKRFSELPTQPLAASHRLWRILASFGNDLITVVRHALGLFSLGGVVFFEMARCVIRPRLIPWREISASVYRNGVSSMLLLGITGFVIGIVMTLQLGVTLKQYGANQQVIGLLGLAVLRELGPVIGALIQAGRAGSSITAGIGGMHLTEELAALRTFGSSPTLRLAMPQVVALVLVMPLLVVWTDFTEIVGGMVAAQFYLGVPHGLFIARFPDSVSLFNFWLGMAKGAVFGLCIAVVSSYFGLTAKASTESLNKNTTRSVVVGLTLILVLDAASGALLANVGLAS